MIPTAIDVCTCFVLANSWERAYVPQKYLSNFFPSTPHQATEKFELLVAVQTFARIKLILPGNYVGETEHLHVRKISCLRRSK